MGSRELDAASAKSADDSEQEATQDDGDDPDHRLEQFVRLLRLHQRAYEADGLRAVEDLYDDLFDEQLVVLGWRSDIGLREASSESDGPLVGHPVSRESDPCGILERFINILVDPQTFKFEVPSDFNTWATEKHYGSACPSCCYRGMHLRGLSQVWTDTAFMDIALYVSVKVNPGMLLDFLKALCVRVPSDTAGDPKSYVNMSSPVQLIQGVSDYEQHAWRDVANDMPRRERGSFRKRHLNKVAIFYSEAPVFGGYPSPGFKDIGDLSFVNFNAAIASTSEKYDVHYITPVCQGITASSWALAFPQFMWQRTMDMALLFILCWKVAPISHKMFHRGTDLPVWPPQLLLLVVLWLGIRGSLHIILLLGMVISYCAYRRGPFAEPRRSLALSFANAYEVLCTGIECFSAYYVICLCMGHWDGSMALTSEEEAMAPRALRWHSQGHQHHHHSAVSTTAGMPEDESSALWKGTFLRDHPGQLSALIFAKWCQFVLVLINFRMLLPRLLPAWMAIISFESAIFLTYLLLLSIGTMLAYYSLPSTMGSDFTAYFTSLYRMFRLDFFADFDSEELEGQGHEEDNDITSSIHFTMELSIMLYALLFPVLLLNMYVGVLSDVYNKCLSSVVNITGIYTSQVTCRLLAYRQFWLLLARQFPRLACIFVGMFSLDLWHGSLDSRKRRSQPRGKGTWIIIPENMLGTEDEISERLTGVEDRLKSMEDAFTSIAQLIQERLPTTNHDNTSKTTRTTSDGSGPLPAQSGGHPVSRHTFH